MSDKPILVVGGGVGYAAAQKIYADHGDDIDIVTVDELKERGFDISNIPEKPKPLELVQEIEKEIERYPTTYTPPPTRRERRKAKRNEIKNNRRSS